MSDFGIGIDTGGTFTDGVIFDLDQKLVISKTKVMTERENLSLSIDRCLENLVIDIRKRGNYDEVIGNIRMVCLSTTLATNAIVEGQGADVGLILIGIDLDKKYPTGHCARINGKIDLRGKIREDLDLEGAKKAIKELKPKVEAFAVSGYMSIRNPVHELDVARLIKKMTGYPVVCGHELSSDLGVYERTVTAVLNARLIPLITSLIEAVRSSIRKASIVAPLMIVRGDGSLISESVAVEKPVETILSGPAASIIGGKVLSRIDNAVIVDMGGTTTDVAVMKAGEPRITEKGALVGGWLTMVKAADISTVGIGGDSHIRVSKERTLEIGPQRVYPLAWLCDVHPHLLDELKEIHENRYFPVNSQPTTILSLIRIPEKIKLNETETSVIRQIENNSPHTIYYIARKLGKDPDLIPWERLVKIGSIHRGGLTPTDVLISSGRLKMWNIKAAETGVKIMANRMGVSKSDFTGRVLDTVYFRLFKIITETAIKDTLPIKFEEHSDVEVLLKQMFRGKREGKKFVHFSARLNVPVIALGAPVKAYFPETVKRLGAKLIIPEYSEVANAIGTVNGVVVERVRIIIKPSESGVFYVYTPEGRRMFMKLEECYEYGEEYGREYAYNRAVESGASDIEIIVKRDERYTTISGGPEYEAGKIFIEAIINVMAKGKPWR